MEEIVDLWNVVFPAVRNAWHEEEVAPDVLGIQAFTMPAQAELLDEQCLVQPDGNVSLGKYGKLNVGGLTLGLATKAVAKQLSSKRVIDDGFHIRVEVVKSDSKVFYVIAAAESGEYVHRLPWDERMTVASAILGIEGLAALAKKTGVWVGRPENLGMKVLKMNWQEITPDGQLANDQRIEPGDRLYVGVPTHEKPGGENLR